MKNFFPFTVALFFTAFNSHAQDDPCPFGEYQQNLLQSSTHQAKTLVSKKPVVKKQRQLPIDEQTEHNSALPVTKCNIKNEVIEPFATGCDAWLPVNTKEKMETATLQDRHTAALRRFLQFSWHDKQYNPRLVLLP